MIKKLAVIFILLLNTHVYAQTWQNIGQGLPQPSGATKEGFGNAISIEGDVALIGVVGNDDRIQNNGKAIIYEKSGNEWIKKVELYPSHPYGDTGFGSAVLLHGDYAFVGAPTISHSITGRGIVYIFKKEGDSWETYGEADALSLDDFVANANFGKSIAMRGNLLAIGAPGADGAATSSGAVYIYELSDAHFTLKQKIFPEVGASTDKFGTSVVFNEDHLFVGSPLYKFNAINLGSVFAFSVSDFNQVARFYPSSTTQFNFGLSIAATDSDLAVAAPYEDNGDGSYGAVLMFKKGAGWHDGSENLKFKPEGEVTKYGLYGSSLVLAEEYLLIGGQAGTIVDLRKKTGAEWDESTILKKFTEPGLVYQNQYGTALGITENTILIGAFNLDIIGESSGVVFTYRKDGAEWNDNITQDHIYEISINAAGNAFGRDVAIKGDYAVAGVPNDDTYGEDAGAAFVFQFNGQTWNRIAKLTASDAVAGDNFGSNVAITEERIVIAATAWNRINYISGKLYVFEKPSSGWANMHESAIVSRVSTTVRGNFGYALAAHGDEIAVSQYDNSGSDIYGQVYIFDKTGTTWSLKATLSPQSAVINSTYGFGASLAFNGQTLVVGAPLGGTSRSGTVYLFEKPQSGWANVSQVANFLPSDPIFYGYFGYSVALHNNTVMVGSTYADSQAGAAYIFEKGDQWKNATEDAKLRPSGTFRKFIGVDVGISNDYAVASSTNEDGLVIFFRKIDGVWKNTPQYDWYYPLSTAGKFGQSIALDNDNLIVGAPSATSEAGGASGTIDFFIKQPTITRVTSNTSDGIYAKDAIINAKVIFSHPIQITGSPTLELMMYNGDIRQAVYNSVTNGRELNFNYTVLENDSTLDLNYRDENSLKGTFTIRSSVTSVSALFMLPTASSSFSLGGSHNIVIDAIKQEEPEIVTGLEDNLSGSAILYPNPFTDELNFELPVEGIHRFEILNALGEIVVSSSVDFRETIHTHNLKNGIYFCRIFVNGKKIIRKIIKV